jgi:predicted transcriptional regulator
MDTLTETGVVERDGSGYRITPAGEAVTEEVQDFLDSIDTVAAAEGVLRDLSEVGIEVGPGALTHGEVVRSERQHPYEPARRFVELFRDSDELRLLAVSSATPMFTDEMHRRIAEGRETEVVCPESVVEANVEAMSDEMSGKLPEYLSVFVHEGPPVTVALFDDKVGFGSHDTEKGTLDVFADTSDDETYAEAETVYESYRDEADRLI